MDLKQFLAEFADVMQVEPDKLNETTEFKKMAEWDSLIIMATIAFADEKFGKKINYQILNQVNTIKDLYDYLNG